MDAILEELSARKNCLFNTRFPDTGPLARHLYQKQMEFFEAGATHTERLQLSANRTGKTESAAFELVSHLTGLYKPWWKGKRFNHPTHWWVCGKDAKTVKGILQTALLGEVGDIGSGMIPHNLLDYETLKDAKKADTSITTFRVKHSTGAYSSVEFKTYDAGRKSFEGTEKNIWLDEEPPMDVYVECLLRTMTGNCIMMLTFTPLMGMSEVVMDFLKENSDANRKVITCTWDDVPHLSEEAKKVLWSKIPPFQRDARSKGIPHLESGAIYPVEQSLIFVKPFDIPPTWKRWYGMDVGWNMTAVVWFAQDPTTKQIYAYSEYARGEAEPSIHAAAIKARGAWIKGAIDPAARGRGQQDGKSLFDMYIDLGLHLVKADNAVESGLLAVLDAFQCDQLKVFDTLVKFKEEFRLYRRDKKGHVVKKDDHCFAPGTMVAVYGGQKSIENITSDDLVLTRSGYKKVLAAGISGLNQIVYKVTTSTGKSIYATANHPFLINGGWMTVDEMQFSTTTLYTDELDMSKRHVVSVTASHTEPYVYDLTVEDVHEFYANDILVHNCMDGFRYGYVTREAVMSAEPNTNYVPGKVSQQYRSTSIISRGN